MTVLRPRHEAIPALSSRPVFQGLSIVLVVVLGLAALLFPTAADWYSRLRHAEEIGGYERVVSGLESQKKEELLHSAEAYNATLSPDSLTDPYAVAGGYPAGPSVEETDSVTVPAAYGTQLAVEGSDAIGRVRYGEVGIDLPIYRGTGDDVLRAGAGHLVGSSLPVGGSSSHTVLTAHSGLPNARLFTPLHEAEVGDEFFVEVLGRVHRYRVDDIAIIEPDELDAIHIVAGRDYVTLFTCTPVGVNSHRLLVRGERIPQENTDTAVGETSAGAGFPWWALIFTTGTGATVLFVRTGGRR